MINSGNGIAALQEVFRAANEEDPSRVNAAEQGYLGAGAEPAAVAAVSALESGGGDTQVLEADGPGSAVESQRKFKILSAQEVLEGDSQPKWVLYPYIEGDATTLMSGERGTYKSFIALDWACRAALGWASIGNDRKVDPKRVLFVSAEGKGLRQRLRGWQSHHFPDGMPQTERSLHNQNLRFIERPVDFSRTATLYDLKAELKDLDFPPDFLVVDTLTRNSDGTIEHSNSATQQYLCQMDSEIRGPYKCAILLVHHLGKDANRGARGPSSLADNTEAEITVSWADDAQKTVLITFGRVKDMEAPEPFSLGTRVVDTGMIDEFGQPVTTLVMVEDHSSAGKRQSRPQVRGRNQKALLHAITDAYKDDGRTTYAGDDLRQMLKEADIPRQRHTEVVQALVRGGYLIKDGGDQYAYVPDTDPCISVERADTQHTRVHFKRSLKPAAESELPWEF